MKAGRSDMEAERAILNLLGIARKAGLVSAGTEAVRSSLKKNECLLLIMSTDISDRVRKDYQEISSRKNVDCLTVAGRGELGRAVGKQQVTILSVNEARMAAKIKELHRI